MKFKPWLAYHSPILSVDSLTKTPNISVEKKVELFLYLYGINQYFDEIEKVILKSDLGLNPNAFGELTIPAKNHNIALDSSRFAD